MLSREQSVVGLSPTGQLFFFVVLGVIELF